MDFLGAVAADVRAEHDVVLRVTMHVLLVEVTGEHFDVATAAVDLLFMLHAELNHEILALIAERLVELCRDCVEPRILCCLQTCQYN